MIFISPHFIPCALCSIPQVDTVGEHGQCGGFEDEFAPITLDVGGPTEGALFQALGDNPVSSAVEVEDLDKTAGLVGEEEGRAAERVELEVIADQLGEGVEAFAHVAGLQRDIDLEASVEGEHGVGVS